jgi:malate synthase
MTERLDRAGLQVDAVLARFLEDEALPGTGIEAGAFWSGLAGLLGDFAPQNRALLAKRDELQAKIDAWHIARRGQPHDHAAYKAYLAEIGYLLPEGPAFSIETTNVDPEVAKVPGPQLVVPVTNARYALNAANARWGSLYDCLYGTDAMGSLPPSGGYERGRGARVIARSRVFLDEAFPIAGTSHADVRRYVVKDGQLLVDDMPLVDPSKFAGYRGNPKAPDSILLRNNGLHVELVFDRAHFIGSRDQALLADVQMESALTAIMDCEDSVACVDAEDKVVAYRNWLGLMKGNLSEVFEKGGRPVERRLAADREYLDPNGSPFTLKGRALMWVRNVGHLMTNPAILLPDGSEVPEGLMDAMVTVAIALHDLKKTEGMRNSVEGSVYVVKPKMHGPEEVAFADAVMARVEEVLGLPKATVKLGIMDEERRTSVNLKECIRAAKGRVAFINTGFLDRTGDEIHTDFLAGPMIRKNAMKSSTWMTSYEDRNVDVALAAGFTGQAQVGKGMWAKPAAMADMVAQKQVHPEAGANCAWVPSPTAATLHALHYLRVDVAARQRELAGRATDRRLLLEVPVLSDVPSEAEIDHELRTNAQSILGYVVRWVGLGIGCSTVPDLEGVGLMEDRATLRISSQHIANWLHHGLVDEERVRAVFAEMAAFVDTQNVNEPGYRPMAADLEGSESFQAALELVFTGRQEPNGYTERVLTGWRQRAKARA